MEEEQPDEDIAGESEEAHQQSRGQVIGRVVLQACLRESIAIAIIRGTYTAVRLLRRIFFCSRIEPQEEN